METPDTQPAPTTDSVVEGVPNVRQKQSLWPTVGARYHLAIVLTLGTIVLLTYANSFTTGFALDNKFIILEDPRLRAATTDNVKAIFQQDYWWPKAVSGLYRPLTTLSFMLNYSILNNTDHPTGYHWINFFAHWLNAALVYFVVLVLMEKLWPAFFVAALFATHPIVTESVTNIIGRADLFATATVLAGFLCYAKSQTLDGGGLNRTIGSICAGVYLLLLGLTVWILGHLQPGFWICFAAFAGLTAAALVISALQTGWRVLPWLTGLALLTTVGVFCKESAVAVLGVMGLYDLTYRLQPKHSNPVANFFVNLWDWILKGYLAVTRHWRR